MVAALAVIAGLTGPLSRPSAAMAGGR
jgi:hypothetical protein